MDIKTTGGIVKEDDVIKILKVISDVFSCPIDEIFNLKPLQKGITNAILSFEIKNEKYVYRHPGTGSETLVDRGREAILQIQASDIKIDPTLIAMSIREGWRISKYIENRPFDYHSVSDMEKGIKLLKRLHDAPVKVRCEFDPKEKWQHLKSMTPKNNYGENYSDYPNFLEIENRINKLYELSKTDNFSKCMTHGDSRDENFLIFDKGIYLIDWEYSGYGDPGFDIGTYVAGGDHSREEVDRIIFTYFGAEPTIKEKRHFYAWIAISGFFYMHWCMFKESNGQKVGTLKQRWYNAANEYSKIALSLYENK